MRPDLRHNPGDLFDSASAGVDVRAAQLGEQKGAGGRARKAAGSSNYRNSHGRSGLPDGHAAGIGRIQIKHDLPWRPLVRLHKRLDQQRIDRIAVAVDLVVLRAVALRHMLQTIERALAGNRRAVRPHHRFELTGQHRKDRSLRSSSWSLRSS